MGQRGSGYEDQHGGNGWDCGGGWSSGGGWLRAEAALDATPIVALTAWPEETARKMVESYGFDGYIGKPIVKITEFVEKVDSFLKIP